MFPTLNMKNKKYSPSHNVDQESLDIVLSCFNEKVEEKEPFFDFLTPEQKERQDDFSLSNILGYH